MRTKKLHLYFAPGSRVPTMIVFEGERPPQQKRQIREALMMLPPSPDQWPEFARHLGTPAILAPVESTIVNEHYTVITLADGDLEVTIPEPVKP